MSRAPAGLVSLAVLLALAVAPAAASAQEVLNATVTRVTDGDTLTARLETGATKTVRLLGIDAPESVDPGKPVECGAREAAARLAALVQGRTVVLTTDRTQDRIDRFGRLIAYVDRPGLDIGLEMVRAGHAGVFVFERPFQRLPTYQQAADAARAAGRAVWSSCAGNFHAPARADEDATSRTDSAEAFVRRYYFLLNERRFSTAWSKFSAGQRRRLGSFVGWRSGFRRTLGTRVNAITVALAGTRAVVRAAIRARDRDVCDGQLVRQFFRVRWVLAPRGDSWVATAVSARKVGGGSVRLTRSQCAPSRPSGPPANRPRPPSSGGRNCDPNYSGCLDPNASDYDCRGGSGDGPRYTGPVQVKGDDHFGLDADGDGVGCEDS